MMIGLGKGNGGFIARPNHTHCRPRHMYGRAIVAAFCSPEALVPVSIEGEGSMIVSMIGDGDAQSASVSGEGTCSVVLTGEGDLANIKWSVIGEGVMSDPGLFDGA